jgi:hypothetical protein
LQDPTISAVRVAPTSRGICGRQSGTETRFFSPRVFRFSSNSIIPSIVHTHIPFVYRSHRLLIIVKTAYDETATDIFFIS